MYTKTSIASLVLAFSLTQANVHINSGLTLAGNLSIDATRYVNNGLIKSMTCTIKTETFEGNGTIDSGKVTVACDEFKYKGTITCSDTCTIYAKKAFDYSMFKRSGSGSFTVIITPYDVQQCTETDLLTEATNTLHNTCLTLTEEEIDKNIKITRHHAFINNINEKNLLESLQADAEKQAEYHRTRLDQTRDENALHSGLLTLGIGAAGMASAAMMYKYDQLLTQKLSTHFSLDNNSIKIGSFITAILSAFPIIASHAYFAEWLNPRHAEKCEKLDLINNKLKTALVTARIQEEVIIKLQ